MVQNKEHKTMSYCDYELSPYPYCLEYAIDAILTHAEHLLA